MEQLEKRRGLSGNALSVRIGPDHSGFWLVTSGAIQSYPELRAIATGALQSYSSVSGS